MNVKHCLLTLFAVLPLTQTACAESGLHEHLASSTRVVAPMILSLQKGGLNEDAIREAADKVMQQHDYRSVRRRMLENIPDTESEESNGFLMDILKAIGGAFSDFIEWLFSGLFQSNTTPTAPTSNTSSSPSSGGFGFSLGDALLFLALAIVILIAIWLIAVVFKLSDGKQRRNRSGLFDDDEELTNLSIPPGELAASTYESRALQFADKSNYRAAIRELLVGSMSWIERAGLIRYRKGLTNRDYVRAVWRQEVRRESYITTALQFERVYFGRRDATEDMFRSCLKSFQETFREEETTAKV